MKILEIDKAQLDQVRLDKQKIAISYDYRVKSRALTFEYLNGIKFFGIPLGNLIVLLFAGLFIVSIFWVVMT